MTITQNDCQDEYPANLLAERLRYHADDCREQEEHNLSGMPEEGTSGHRSAMWLRELRESFEKAADAITSLEAEATLLGASATSMQKHIDGLEAERARLRLALEPFAREAKNWDDAGHADEDSPACDVFGSACRNCGLSPDYEPASFTIGDLRQARAALATAPSGKEGEGE